jgi:hypothetical protein
MRRDAALSITPQKTANLHAAARAPEAPVQSSGTKSHRRQRQWLFGVQEFLKFRKVEIKPL